MKKTKLNYLTLTFSLITSLLINSFPLSVRAYDSSTLLEEDLEVDYDDLLELSNVYDESENECNKTNEEDVDTCYQMENEIIKRNEMYDNYIRKYSSYFNLREDEVINIAREYTDDYTTKSSISINGRIIDINDPEKFAMFVCYSIFNNTDEYGLDREMIVSENSIVNIDNSNEEIILSNGYTFNDFVYKVSTYLNIDSNMVLAISDYECGYQTSSQAECKNNFGGLKNDSGYMTFPTPEAGIIALVFTVDKIYYENDINDIYELSGVYVNGSINKPSENWVSSVSCIENDIDNNEDDTYTLSYK